MPDVYTLPKVINILKNRNFEKFYIGNDYASIYSYKVDEIIIEAPDNKIPDEKVTLAIEVLKHLDECVSNAHQWLEHFNLKNDRWYPDALDKGFEIIGLYFGRYAYGPNYNDDGFTISFRTKNYYPCGFTVKFFKNMHPFAVEEWVE